MKVHRLGIPRKRLQNLTCIHFSPEPLLSAHALPAKVLDLVLHQTLETPKTPGPVLCADCVFSASVLLLPHFLLPSTVPETKQALQQRGLWDD